MDGFIETNASRLRSDKGRPRIDDDDAIIAHFVRGRDQGMNVTAIAKPGLRLCGFELDSYGKQRLVVKRYISAATLERRYRLLRTFVDAELANRKLWNPVFGMRVPSRPSDFASSAILKRGRPKKKRRG